MDEDMTDFRWLSEHPEELIRRYGGQWLAISEGIVVAAGDDAVAVYEKARQQEPDREILMEHVEREAIDSLYALVLLA